MGGSWFPIFVWRGCWGGGVYICEVVIVARRLSLCMDATVG